MFGLSIIIAVIQGVGTLFLPRTPRYLLLKGKHELALNTLQKIRGRGTDVGKEFDEMRVAILEEKRHHWYVYTSSEWYHATIITNLVGKE